jgi:putative acetyltransferase
MVDIIIREIQKKDNAQIAQVIRDVLIEFDVPKIGTAYADPQLDCMFETYKESKSTYYVVEKDGKIIGGAGISQLENSTESICELQKMYFLEEARGKGIGLHMMEQCLIKALYFGYEKCYLETMQNMFTAQKLYEKVGFEYIDSPMGNTGHSNCQVWMLKSLKSK